MSTPATPFYPYGIYNKASLDAKLKEVNGLRKDAREMLAFYSSTNKDYSRDQAIKEWEFDLDYQVKLFKTLLELREKFKE